MRSECNRRAFWMAASSSGVPAKLSELEYNVSTVRGEAVWAEAVASQTRQRNARATVDRMSRRSVRIVMSKRESNRELDLTRRTGFTGRQTGPRNLRERRAADDVPGRTEVRAVEQIEHVD